MLLLCGHHYIQSNTNKMHTLHSTWTHVGWRCGFPWVINADSLVFANSSQLCAVMTPGHCKQLCMYLAMVCLLYLTHILTTHTHTPKTHTHQKHTHTKNTHTRTQTPLTGSGSGSREILTSFLSRSQISTVPSQAAVASSEEAIGWNRRILHLSSWPAREETRGGVNTVSACNSTNSSQPLPKTQPQHC